MKVLSELFWRTWMEPWSRRTRCLPQKRQAVGRLAEAGILFAITSGRPPRGMQTLIRDLNITTVIAGFNGGVYTSPRLDPIVMRDLPKTATARAIEIIREGGLVPRLYTRYRLVRAGSKRTARRKGEQDRRIRAGGHFGLFGLCCASAKDCRRRR
jgi:hydroxymethylpyrimidine pyrophosphatase-like HAD family hydrolase